MKEQILKCKLEILSPIHIGTGEELDPQEYIIKNGTLYFVGYQKMLELLTSENKKQLFNILQRDDIQSLIELRKFIYHHIQPEKDYEWKIKVSPEVESWYIQKLGDIKTQLKIYPFIHSQSQRYIPGSSLKGAIRTAILNYWIEKNNLNGVLSRRRKELEDRLLSERDRKRMRKVKREIESFAKSLEEKLTSLKLSEKEKKDIFQILKIEDVTLPFDSTICVEVKNMTLKSKDNLTSGIPTYREVTLSKLTGADVVVDFEVKLDYNLLPSKSYLTITKNDILEALNGFYLPILESEANRLFASFPEISENYKKIKTLFTSSGNEDSALLRIGWGSGFESMTLKKFRIPQNSVRSGRRHIGWGYSKHLVSGRLPLGWVKLKFLT